MHQWYEGNLLFELFTETNEEGVDESPIFHAITEFAEFITNGLDPLAENGDGGITLGSGAKLGVKGIDASVAVVLEELLESNPQFCYRSVVVGDEVKELGGDPSVDPLDDREIVFDPPGIMRSRNRGGIDMMT